MPSVQLAGTQVNDICVMLENANSGSSGQVANLCGTNADFAKSSVFSDVTTFDGYSSGGTISISSKTTGAGAAPANWSAVAVAFSRAIHVAQTQSNQTTATATGTTLTRTYANAVIPGSCLVADVQCTDVASETFSVSDSVNGSWGAAVQSVDDGTKTTARFLFPNTAAGTPVVTVTYGITALNRGLWINEVRNAAVSPLDGSAGQTQASPGNGTDAITSGTATNTNQPGLILGLSFDDRTVAPVAPAPGTAFIDNGAGWTFAGGNQARLESKRITTTTAVAATFTGTTGVVPTTLMVLLDELAPTVANYLPPGRRAIEEIAREEWQYRRSIFLPPPQTADVPPLIVRRAAQEIVVDEYAMRSRRIAMPPDFAPVVIARRAQQDTAQEESARRASLPAATPVVSVPLLGSRSREEAATDETAARPRAVPLALQADTAPLQNRRATERVTLDEQATRPRAVPLAVQPDPVPLLGRRASEQVTIDEAANRIKAVPLALQADTAPLQNRRITERVLYEEVMQRVRPLLAPSVDFAPLTIRKVSEDDAGWERAAVRIFAPPPSLVGAPLVLRRAQIEDGSGADERAARARAVPPAGTVDSPPARNPRAREELIVDEHVFRPSHPVPVSGIAPGVPPLTMRRSAEEIVPDERAKRVQALPSPQTVDLAPLQNRRATERVASEDRAARVIPLPAASSDAAPLLARRAREDVTGVDESARRVAPAQQQGQGAPLIVRRLAEVLGAEESARRAPLPAASSDVAPLVVRRVREEVSTDELTRVRRVVPRAPVLGFAPQLPRKWYSDDSFPDERVTRPRYLVAISFPRFLGGCAHVDFFEQSARASSSTQRARASSFLC